MNSKKAYQDKMEARLDELGAEIDKLKAKADQAGATARLKYQEQVARLRTKQHEAREKLDELNGAADDAWKDLKAGMELAWDSLGEAVSSARARFD